MLPQARGQALGQKRAADRGQRGEAAGSYCGRNSAQQVVLAARGNQKSSFLRQRVINQHTAPIMANTAIAFVSAASRWSHLTGFPAQETEQSPQPCALGNFFTLAETSQAMAPSRTDGHERCAAKIPSQPMSALGQKPTFDSGNSTSALPQKRTSFSTIAMSALCQERT